MCYDAHEIGDDKQAVLSLGITDAESAVGKVANCESFTIFLANRKKRTVCSFDVRKFVVRTGRK